MSRATENARTMDDVLKTLNREDMSLDEQFAAGILNLLADISVSLAVLADRKGADNE